MGVYFYPKRGNVLMKKYILILGGSVDQLFMIKTAQEMELGTIVFDGNKNAPGLENSDISKNIDFSNLEEVFLYVDELLTMGINICGVSTMGSDVPHLIAAISDRYNWAGPSIRTGELTTNKYLMKKVLQNKDIPIPKFSLVSNYKEIETIWMDWDCDQIIIKPTDRAGSRGVRIISNKNNISTDFNHALSQSPKKEVLIEEYINGPQISTESIICDNYFSTPGFADRVYEDMESFHPQIMENGGWVPTTHSKNTVKKVNQLVEKAARVLGINRGVAKGDVVLHPEKGPMVIEIAARLSGGDFCESLVPLGSGINYVSDVIRMAIGKKPDLKGLKEKYSRAVANRYFFLPSGTLQEIKGLESISELPEIYKMEIYYKPGYILPKIESHGQRVGVFIVVSDKRKPVQKIIDYVYNTIKFKINDKWFSGNPKFYSPNI